MLRSSLSASGPDSGPEATVMLRAPVGQTALPRDLKRSHVDMDGSNGQGVRSNYDAVGRDRSNIQVGAVFCTTCTNGRPRLIPLACDGCCEENIFTQDCSVADDSLTDRQCGPAGAGCAGGLHYTLGRKAYQDIWVDGYVFRRYGRQHSNFDPTNLNMICNADIEAFALNTPALRKKLIFPRLSAAVQRDGPKRARIDAAAMFDGTTAPLVHIYPAILRRLDLDRLASGSAGDARLDARELVLMNNTADGITASGTWYPSAKTAYNSELDVRLLSARKERSIQLRAANARQ